MKKLDKFSVFVGAFLVILIVGCVAMYGYGNGLYELRSLAVEKEWNGQGIGRLLTNASIEHVHRLGGLRFFALTRKIEFFLKAGFVLSEKDFFPQKVWADCVSCHKRDRCDESAVHIDF